jgi:disulfide bond formation protein DsbB
MPNLTAESYLNFVVAYILGLAALFQLPLLLFLFDHVRPFPPGSLLSTQRFVIIGATVVAAIITPTPDAFNMAIVAIPIVAIYQFGVIAVYARRKTQTRLRKRQATAVMAAPVVVEPIPEQTLTELIREPEHKELPHVPTVARTPVQPSPPAFKARRTMDGVIRTPATSVVVPQMVNRQMYAAPRRRSVDGFSVV